MLSLSVSTEVSSDRVTPLPYGGNLKWPKDLEHVPALADVCAVLHSVAGTAAAAEVASQRGASLIMMAVH